METTTAGMRARKHRRMTIGRFAPAALGLLAAVTASVCVSAPAAAARPRSSMRPLITRVRLHDGRLWSKGAKRSHGGVPRARAAIVGGNPISIGQAPWQVVVIAFPEPKVALLCGGSILNETEILTAGHCVYNPSTKERIAPGEILVGAGSEDIEIEPEQVRIAGGVRVHPDYNPRAALPAPDDVAVIKLEEPLSLNADVQPISLVSAGSLLQEGAVDLTGFGEENPTTEELNGRLYAIEMGLGYSRECSGEADAVFLCASTPHGSPCFGDSGSALTLPQSPAVLAGVMDTIEVIGGRPCLPGTTAGFVNVAAPEIRDFVEGDEDPPLAPRGGGVSMHGTPVVGDTLTCESGSWSNSPTFTYMFIDSGGAVIQQGPSSTYTLTAADVGRSILCQMLAGNAGGTGIGRTAAAGPVRSNPQEEEAARKRHEEEEAAAKKQREAEEAAKKQREAEEAATARKVREEEEATRRAIEEGSKQLKKLAEEEATKRVAEAAATKKHEEEVAREHGEEAKGGVLGARETSKSSANHPTRTQLLAKALAACRKQPKHRRAQCAARAHRRYGSKGSKGKKK